MDVVVYTPRENICDEHKYLVELLEGGLMHLNVYKPGANRNMIMEWLSQLGENYWSRITLHLYDEFIPLNINGYHLSRKYLKLYSLSETVKLKSVKQTVSVSAHDVNEWLLWKDSADSIVISPVYKSISKNDVLPFHSPDQWKEIFSAQPGIAKKIALGGVDPNRANELSASGFGAMAIGGWLWKDPSFINKRVSKLSKYLLHA